MLQQFTTLTVRSVSRFGSYFRIRKKELGLNYKHLKVKVLFDSLFSYFII